jgi:acetoin utilization deacetylase AcuC-like enzyme
MHIYYSPPYNDTGVEFETFRKAIVIAESLFERPIAGVEVVAPQPATFDELTAVHDVAYVNAVATGHPLDLAASNGLGWDDRIFGAVAASNGGVRDAVLWALANGTVAGSLSSGLHHAGPFGGNGYCTFNGLVMAARAAVAADAQRVLIVDFDAHCGGGTAAGIEHIDAIEQIDVSVSSFDRYTSRPDAQLVLTDGEDYLDVIEASLASVSSPESVDLVIYNAGMDPHRLAGGSRHIDTDTIATRERLLFDWAGANGLPVAWVLAGGYTVGTDMAGLVDLHRITITEAARATTAAG